MFGLYLGFRITFNIEDLFWQHWYLRYGENMLFITYNCPIESCSMEQNEINAILSSLTPED